MTDLTNTDKLVLVMAKMHEEGVREYHEAELTVAAWRMFPESFGLGDFWNEYPDHKRVCNAYQTSKDSRTGPIGRGYMTRTRPNHYRITSQCLARAVELEQSDLEEDTNRHVLTKEESDSLKRRLSSILAKHWVNKNEVSPNWNATAAFLEVNSSFPRGKTGTMQKAINGIKKGNYGSVRNWLAFLTDLLDTDIDLFSVVGAGGSGGANLIRREQLVMLAELTNAVLDHWADELNHVGVNVDEIDLITIPEGTS